MNWGHWCKAPKNAQLPWLCVSEVLPATDNTDSDYEQGLSHTERSKMSTQLWTRHTVP